MTKLNGSYALLLQICPGTSLELPSDRLLKSCDDWKTSKSGPLLVLKTCLREVMVESKVTKVRSEVTTLLKIAELN